VIVFFVGCSVWAFISIDALLFYMARKCTEKITRLRYHATPPKLPAKGAPFWCPLSSRCFTDPLHVKVPLG